VREQWCLQVGADDAFWRVPVKLDGKMIINNFVVIL
jgi:hypothetical protein